MHQDCQIRASSLKSLSQRTPKTAPKHPRKLIQINHAFLLLATSSPLQNQAHHGISKLLIPTINPLFSRRQKIKKREEKESKSNRQHSHPRAQCIFHYSPLSPPFLTLSFFTFLPFSFLLFYPLLPCYFYLLLLLVFSRLSPPCPHFCPLWLIFYHSSFYPHFF